MDPGMGEPLPAPLFYARTKAALLGGGVALALTGCSGAGTNLVDLTNQPIAEPNDGGAREASTAGGNGIDAGVVLDPFANAPAFVSTPGATTHNPGLSCIQTGCHATSGGTAAPDFFLGGTVYTDYTGQKPAIGAEIRVVDAAGHAVSVYSGPQGNFYVGAAAAKDLTFPVAVGARDGTTTRPMITSLQSGQTSCALKGCHATGGGPTTNTGSYYPIHVP
jgi:hypothetical protein